MNLSAATIAEVHKQRNASPWVWLYEIFAIQNATETKPFRVTSHDQDVVFESKTYRPFPIKHDAVQQDSKGNLPSVQLKVANVRRELNRYVELADGGSTNDVRIIGLNKAALATADARIWTLQIKTASVTAQWVILRLGMPAFYQRPMPLGVYTRHRCEHAYKHPDTCAYAGTLPSCDKTYNGADGCLVHGADEVMNGRPKMHPRRYGAFPSIPRRVG